MSDPKTIDLDKFLSSNISIDDLRRAQNLLNSSSRNNLWSILTTTRDVSENIVNALGRFDWDVFMPREDEKALEELAGSYQKQRELGITYVIGGIVFDSDLPTSPTSKFKNTTIRIRTNLSSVMNPSKYKERLVCVCVCVMECAVCVWCCVVCV